MSDRVKVVVTGAAGQISYSLIPRLVDGTVFGNKIVDLELVEIPAVLNKLEGMVMEMEDSFFPHLGDINITDNFAVAAESSDWFLLVGSIPRGIVLNGKKIEERSDLLKVNGGIFIDQGKAIGEKGKENAKILVVNDLGGSVDGSGGASEMANAVVEEIKAYGGEALANGCSVSDKQGVDNMVAEVMDAWGRIDVLVNNAGILRDKSFHKISLEEFNAVMDVHFQGSVYSSHAVYPIMREQNFGRIIFTTSSGGLFGNFGQANYGAAKMAMVGLMNCLKIEGQKYNVYSSAVAPVALSRMTEALFPEGVGERFLPEYVTPAVIYLASEDAPNGAIIGAGAGVFTQFRIFETMGAALGTGEDMTPENIAANWESVSNMENAKECFSGPEQTIKILEQADK